LLTAFAKNLKLVFERNDVAADDTAKVLDFGLAKTLESDIASIDISSSPTISRMATQQGVLLGTAAYMSRERQAEVRAQAIADCAGGSAKLRESAFCYSNKEAIIHSVGRSGDDPPGYPATHNFLTTPPRRTTQDA
jgi:hypothetical protein